MPSSQMCARGAVLLPSKGCWQREQTMRPVTEWATPGVSCWQVLHHIQSNPSSANVASIEALAMPSHNRGYARARSQPVSTLRRDKLQRFGKDCGQRCPAVTAGLYVWIDSRAVSARRALRQSWRIGVVLFVPLGAKPSDQNRQVFDAQLVGRVARMGREGRHVVVLFAVESFVGGVA